MLVLAIKALLRRLASHDPAHHPADSGAGDALYSPEFVQCIVYLTSQGTQFSRQWLVKDLEVLSLTLYTKDKEASSGASAGGGRKRSAKSGDRDSARHKAVAAAVAARLAAAAADDDDNNDAVKGNSPKSVDVESEDPWADLDEAARLCFRTMFEHYRIPVPVMRAMYEMQDRSTNALLMAIHDR